MSRRRQRELSVVLGLLLMVMAGAIVVVWVSQPGRQTGAPATTLPGATRSPTAVAGTPAPNGTPTPTGSLTVSPTGTPLPTDSPPPSPSPSPDETAGQPEQAIAFVDVGLDTSGTTDEELQPRYFTFVAHGPGRIEANLDNVSFGRVRMCLWQGEPDQAEQAECRTTRGGRIRQSLEAGAPQAWTVSLIGSQAGASPTADLDLSWPGGDAEVRLEGFRFQGEAIENYNGFTAVLGAATRGFIDVSASFDDGLGGSYPWYLTIAEQGSDDAPFAAEGNGSSMQASSEVDPGGYRVTLSNRETVAVERVLVSAVLNWP